MYFDIVSSNNLHEIQKFVHDYNVIKNYIKNDDLDNLLQLYTSSQLQQ